MKRLILMRHAKSDWSGGALTDFDRPLNKRGRESAAALGDWLRREGLLPGQVLCSSAARTQETCTRLALPEATPVALSRRLYLASADQIMGAVHTLAQEEVVLVIGHNPGIGMCAEGCVAPLPDHPQFRQYPTGATLVVDFDTDGWDQINRSKGRLHGFVVPREV